MRIWGLTKVFYLPILPLMGNEKTMYSKALIKARSEEIINEINTAQMCGIERFIHRLRIAPDDEEYLDILAQGRLALILNHNGFSCIELEPLKKGPDIRITSEGDTFYFEVKRRRPKEEDYEFAESEGASWVNFDKDNNVINLISGKLKQLLDGEINIVVIWSNTIMVGQPGIEEACKSISKEIVENTGSYAKFSGIVLVEDAKIDLRLPDDIYLFINGEATRLLPKPLVRKLSTFCRDIYTIQYFFKYL